MHPSTLNNPENILVIGTSTDERLLAAASELRNRCPEIELLLLRPRREHPLPDSAFNRIIRCEGNRVTNRDIQQAPEAGAVVLVYSHTGRPAYSDLVRQCLKKSHNCFLFNDNGLQPLDRQDTTTQWPSPILARPTSSPASPAQRYTFFRPSDRTAHALAAQHTQRGHQVTQIDTIAALQQSLSRTDAVFFDWCLADYGVLYTALQRALDASKLCECFLALDLADVAEDDSIRQRLIALNQRALPCMQRIHILASRMHLAKRYSLDQSRLKPIWNIPDTTVWQKRTGTARRKKEAPIRFVYHGLHYFWHELAEFLPVFNALTALHPAHLDIYGRLHESVSCGGESLFPNAEQQGHDLLEHLSKRSDITLHGFTPPNDLAQAVADADFYVGITASKTLMADTEMRTGIMEARQTRCRILHKTTHGTRSFGLQAGQDFLPIDAAQPQVAATHILNDFLDRPYD